MERLRRSLAQRGRHAERRCGSTREDAKKRRKRPSRENVRATPRSVGELPIAHLQLAFTNASVAHAGVARRRAARRSRSSSTNRSTTASARSSKSLARAKQETCTCGRGSGTRRRSSFPRSRPRCGQWAPRLKAPRRPRRRDRRAGRQGAADRLPAAAGRIHLSEVDESAGRRQRSRSSRSISCATARAICAAVHSSSAARRSNAMFGRDEIAAAAHQRDGARRRPRAVRRALAEGWEGLIAKHAASLYSRASARRTGASSRSSTNRNSSSAAGPSRGRRARTSARCCSACTTRRQVRNPERIHASHESQHHSALHSTSATPAPASTSASSRA